MDAARRRAARLRLAIAAGAGGATGLCAGLLWIAWAWPAAPCAKGTATCAVRGATSPRSTRGAGASAALPSAALAPDAGAGRAGSETESGVACAMPGWKPLEVRLRSGRPPGELASAAELLIGATEYFGLDHDAAEALWRAARHEDEDGGACGPSVGGSIVVGGSTFCALTCASSHEWDGMYGRDEVVLLGRENDEAFEVVHALTQWRQDVPDCYTELLQQRRATRDLDGDGVTELCVESIFEIGNGLFAVMDVKRWRPQRRERSLRAYRVHPRQGRLLRAEALDVRCPRSGYEPFARHTSGGDSVAWRVRVQRGPLCPPSCAAPLEDACGNVHFGARELH